MGQEELMAVVMEPGNESVGGDVPIFYGSTEDERAKTAMTLAKVLKAMVHEINGVYVIVKH